MKRERKIKWNQNPIWNGSIIAALVAAIAVFVIMLQTEKNMLEQYEKDTIYVVTQEIPKGQVITQNNCNVYMTIKEMDKTLIPETALCSIEQIEEMAAVYQIEPGTLVTRGMFEPLQEVTAKMQNPVIAGFKAEDMYQVVGGTLRVGDRIHIYHVDEDGFVSLSWSDVFVQEVFDASGAAIGNEDSISTAQRVNIFMDKSDVALFYTELAQGALRVVKVCE